MTAIEAIRDAIAAETWCAGVPVWIGPDKPEPGAAVIVTSYDARAYDMVPGRETQFVQVRLCDPDKGAAFNRGQALFVGLQDKARAGRWALDGGWVALGVFPRPPFSFPPEEGQGAADFAVVVNARFEMAGGR